MKLDPLAIFATLCGFALVALVAFENSLAVIVALLNAIIVPLAFWARGEQKPASLGKQSSDYELLGKLGEGGMGEVFQARQAGLERVVALKRIKPQDATEVDRERFRREARVLSALSNPHTIQIYDAGIRKDGSFYYVMELLDGMNLDQLIQDFGPLSPPRVIHILRQALMSLVEAHERGLVHRDLKPANLMVCRYGGDFDFVKVLDFGLVKVGNREDEAAVSLTGAGALPGTPAFLPPEAVLGSSFVDARADLYSLAAIGYFLLTGAFLFEADTPIAMVQAHLNEVPRSVSERAPGPVPEALAEVIRKCLAKDQNLRPASARQVLLELEELALLHPWSAASAAAFWEKIPKMAAIPEARLPSELPGGF